MFVLGWAVFLAAWAVNERSRERDLDERGIEVPAEVVRVSVDDSGDATTSEIVVRFAHRGDDPTVTETEITYDGDFEADFPDAEAEGVRIQYDPEHPGRARIAGDSHNRALELFVGAGLCALVAAGIAAWTGVGVPEAPTAGFEPATYRLGGGCSIP